MRFGKNCGKRAKGAGPGKERCQASQKKKLSRRKHGKEIRNVNRVIGWNRRRGSVGRQRVRNRKVIKGGDGVASG